MSSSEGRIAFAVPMGTPSGRLVAELAMQWSALVDRVVLVTTLPLLPSGEVDGPSLLAVARQMKALPPPTAESVWLEAPVRAAPLGQLEGLVPPTEPPRSRQRPTGELASTLASEATSIRWSYVEGPRVSAEHEWKTLRALFEETVAAFPAHGIVHINEQGARSTQTYAELRVAALHVAAGLRAAGLRRGGTVLLQCPDSVDFIAAMWGALYAGVAVVPLATPPSYQIEHPATERLLDAAQRLDASVVLVSGRIHDAASVRLSNLGPGANALRCLTVESLVSAERSQAELDAVEPPELDDVALYFLTSGSTGRPKIVPQTHRRVGFFREIARQSRKESPDDVSLNWMPLDHVGSCLMSSISPALVGSSQVHVDTGWVLAAPLRWLDLLEAERATMSWAPNFAYGQILQEGAELERRRWDLSRVRYLLNGGEAVVARTCRTFLELLATSGLRDDVIRPAWGMSETCSAVSFSDEFSRASSTDNDPTVEVGGPAAGTAFRIVDEQQQVVPEGIVGALHVRGPTVLTGYVGGDDPGAFSDGGWFATGDRGVLRRGRLTLTGRDKDVVVVAGVKYACAEIEAAAERVPSVLPSSTAACPYRPAGAEVDECILFFSTTAEEERDFAEVLRRLRETVAKDVGLVPTHLVRVQPDELPRTGIGKVKRAELAVAFGDGAFDAQAREAARLLERPPTVPAYLSRRLWVSKVASGSFEGEPLTVVGGSSGFVARLRGAVPQAAEWIAPAQPDGFRASLAAFVGQLEGRGVLPEYWLWELGASPVPELHALLRLLSATPSAPQRMRLVVLAERTREVGSLRSDAAAATGLVRAAANELPWLDARLVARAADEPPERLLLELAEPSHEREVWLGSERYVPRLEQLLPTASSANRWPFERGSLIAVIGALGAVGSTMARALLRRGHSVVAVGRGSLDAGPGSARRARVLRELRSLGAVEYLSLDLTEQLPAAARTRLSRTAGVVMAAGTVPLIPLGEQSTDELERQLAPWSRGLGAVIEALPSAAPLVVVGFAARQLGGPGTACHGAATALAASRLAQARASGRFVRLVALTQWGGASTPAAARRFAEAQGLATVSPLDAENAFAAALQHGAEETYIGIDGAHPRAARHFHAPARLQLEPAELVAGTPGDSGAAGGRRVFVEALPRNAAGELDLETAESWLIAGAAEAANTLDASEPATARLAEAWHEVLGQPLRSLEDDIFATGADSLRAVKLAARLTREFGSTFTLQRLFEAPTARAILAAAASGDRPTRATVARVSRDRFRRASGSSRDES